MRSAGFFDPLYPVGDEPVIFGFMNYSKSIQVHRKVYLGCDRHDNMELTSVI